MSKKTAEAPDEWDPKEHEKEWYRNIISGQRGWKVTRKGDPRVRLADYTNDVNRKLDGDWVPDDEKRKMTRAQVGQICFEADKKLCFFIGLKENATKQWNDLHEEKRREWIESGPRVHPVRKAVGEAIRAALAGEIE
jgi:hypothetical protein